ncbi:MAG: WG repeat-containing protein [Bacteroidota bacterium]|nr:WG repeat-containing protein [Bacteroidota bacterium]
MKYRIFIILFFIIPAQILIAQTPIVKKDVSKLYGIADKKTGLWLTKPIYKKIVEQYEDSLKKKPCCFIAYNKKDVGEFIDKSGKKIISQKFDYVGEYLNNIYLVSINNKNSFYSPQTNLMQKIGWVDKYNSPFFIAKKSIVKLYKGEKFCLLNLNAFDTAIFVYDNAVDFSDFNQYDTTSNWVVRENKKYGTINCLGKQIIPCIYDTLIKAFQIWDEVFIDDYFIRKDNKWGVSSNTHKILISPKFESIDVRIYKYLNKVYYAPKLYLPVKENGKWGVVDSVGNYTIKNNYDTILNISNSEIYVRKNGKMGIIDFKENIIFPFIYDYIESTDINFFKKKTARSYLVNNGCKKCSTDTIGGLWGIADVKGNLIQPIDAQIIKLYRNYTYLNQDYSSSEDSTLIGYLWNRGGEKKQILLGTDTVEMQDMDVNGNEFYVKVWKANYSSIIKGGKSGVISTDGKEIIPIKYDDLCFTIRRENEDRGPLYGNYISKPNISLKESYNVEDNNLICYKLQGKSGVINWKGQTIIPPIYDSVMYVKNEVEEIIYNKDSVKSDNQLFLIKDVYLGYLSENRYYYSKEGKQLGIIDKEVNELNYVNFLDFNSQQPFYANYVIACKNAKVDTFCIKTNQMTFDANGMEIYYQVCQYFYTHTNGKYNIIDPQTHSYILPQWADDIIFCPDNTLDSIRYNKRISNSNTYVDYFYGLNTDSIFTLDNKIYKTFESNPNRRFNNRTYSENDSKNIFCFKVNNHFFLVDAFTKKIINANNGFDAIYFNGKNWVTTTNNIIELYSITGQKQN